jgi:two-component system CheB/CheR fusion protein
VPIGHSGDDTLVRPAPRAAGERPIRILVVDDNVDAADGLKMLLELEGEEVRVAYDGESALAAARQFHPQIVLLDVGMPGMDGYEIARRLRLDPETRGTILVAITGWGQSEDRRRSMDAGIDYHLVKPVEPATLQRLVNALKTKMAV